MENNTRLQQRTEMQLQFWIVVLLLILTQRGESERVRQSYQEGQKAGEGVRDLTAI